MPRPKQFGKENRKKSKHTVLTPQTADDYLAAGVDFEEAGEKWRAGDAVKSSRFFLRAIATYDEGLTIFPRSFDLAYNKARVQYEITQYPRLVVQVPGTVVEMLTVALESSRVALGLRQDDRDVLFNTAQALTSLVEAYIEDRSSNVPNEDSLRLLEEAMELFQRCLALQEYHHDEAQAQIETETIISTHKAQPSPEIADSEASGSATSASSQETLIPSDNGEDQVQEVEEWATLVEPVTKDALLDTILAQVETLTLLCTLLSSSNSYPGLSWIEDYATTLFTVKVPAYIEEPSRTAEVALARANLLAALADANYRAGRLDAVTYARNLNDEFATLDLSQNAEGLVDRAEAFVTFASTLATSSAISPFTAQTHTSNPPLDPLRWRAYTTALENLSDASKLTPPSHPHNTSALYFLRGDIELHRYHMGQGDEGSTPYEAAVKNQGVLLKNAATYYRGAEALARAHGDDDDVVMEGMVKSALVAALGGEVSKLKELVGQEVEGAVTVRELLMECVKEGVVAAAWFERTILAPE